MGSTVVQLYRTIDDARAYCFNVESTTPLGEKEMECLRLVLADGFLIETVSTTPVLKGERVVEVGPRLNFATAWSSNMVSICRAIGLDSVTRVERSRRYVVPPGITLDAFISGFRHVGHMLFFCAVIISPQMIHVLN